MQVLKDAYLSSWAIFEASKSVTVIIEIKSFVLCDKNPLSNTVYFHTIESRLNMCFIQSKPRFIYRRRKVGGANGFLRFVIHWLLTWIDPARKKMPIGVNEPGRSQVIDLFSTKFCHKENLKMIMVLQWPTSHCSSQVVMWTITFIVKRTSPLWSWCIKRKRPCQSSSLLKNLYFLLI